MRKIALIIALAHTFSHTLFAATDAEFDALKSEVAKLRGELNEVRKNTAQDNLKFSADLRSSVDHIRYKFADGKTASNPDLLSNRLWLNMKYQPQSNISFFGQLAYHKLYGDSLNHNQRGGGLESFDWVSSESAADDTLKVRQAFFIYNGKFGENLPFNASIGRRPSTNGLPLNFREDDAPQSPLSQMVNAEFDGASFQLSLDKVTGFSGAYAKLCLGRGLTNAKPRFSSDGADFAADESGTHRSNIDMAGLIVQPYYDGQHRVVTQFIRAVNLIGYEFDPLGMPKAGFRDFGAMNAATISYVQEGIGEFVSDFLDNTKFFASYSISQTDPESGAKMLGSTDSKLGQNFYVGAQFPAFWAADGAIGIEFNHGDRYWRSFTYAEDTMIGSKLAARGNTYEIYYTQPIATALSFQARYTFVRYDYSGSNAFFGEEGAPQKITDQGGVVKEASDLRFYIRYKY
ncbi:hypothetical protein AGMMS49521_0470 [Campylobacterota bacterium]|nr:hypothetical protein AGMMS49521_0470 [Campylobacterota bacterium]